MKKNNKLILIITAVVLAVALIATGAIWLFTKTGDCVISIASTKALAGDTVQVPITIQKNDGIWGGQIIIDYDSDKLSFVSVANGGVFDECEANDTGDSVVLLVTQSSLENTKENGTIATVSFKVKVSAEKGKTDLNFNSDSNFCNVDEEMLDPILENGSITVK